MERLKKALDPTQVGSDAGKLASGLHQRIVGQDEDRQAGIDAGGVARRLRHGRFAGAVYP